MSIKNGNPWVYIFEILEVLGSHFEEFTFILTHPSKLEEAKALVEKGETKKIVTFVDENTSQLKKEFFKLLPKLSMLIEEKGIKVYFVLMDTTTTLKLSLKRKIASEDIDILENMWRKSH